MAPVLGYVLCDNSRTGGELTHYHTIPRFDTVKMYSCGKHCEKRRNCLLQAISPFLTMFSTLYGTDFPFQTNFKMSSAICFNLDQSKMLSSGKRFKPTQQTFIALENDCCDT